MTLITALDKAVRAVCPIDGISVGNAADKATWKAQYAATATTQQKAAAATAIANFTYDPVGDGQSDDTDLLNAALAEQGSLSRALAMVMFAEINKLRVKDGDPAYTLAQFKAALQAQMRT